MDLEQLAKKNNLLVSDFQDGEPVELHEDEISQLVSFTLEDVEYGIDILQIHEIMRVPDITCLPNTPKFIEGLINLRGSVIPVVDVRERFNLPGKQITEQTRIIVVETGGKLIGLLVDSVYQVVRLPHDNIDPPAELIDGISEEFIKGIGRLKERLIIILNLTTILFDESEGASQMFA